MDEKGWMDVESPFLTSQRTKDYIHVKLSHWLKPVTKQVHTGADLTHPGLVGKSGQQIL